MSIEPFGLQAAQKPLVGTFGRFWMGARGHWCYVSVVDQSPCGRFVAVKGGRIRRKARWIKASDLVVREARAK